MVPSAYTVRYLLDFGGNLICFNIYLQIRTRFGTQIHDPFSMSHYISDFSVNASKPMTFHLPLPDQCCYILARLGKRNAT